MTMITPSYLGETIEYSSLHACRSTLEDPTFCTASMCVPTLVRTRRALPVPSQRNLIVLGDATWRDPIDSAGVSPI